MIFKHLLQEKRLIKTWHDDNFGSIDTTEKIVLNKINARVAAKINDGLDYSKVIEDINSEDNLLTDLKILIIDNLYKEILVKNLKSNISKKKLESKTTSDLHNLAKEYSIDFNKIIYNLHESIENNIEIQDFNSMNIAWIIIAYFFEICDIGVHQI